MDENQYLRELNRLLWIPRVFMITFIVFISLFALDVIGGNKSLVLQSGGFLIHLIPSFILVIGLIISWKHPMIGGYFFLLAGIIFTLFFRANKNLEVFLMISVPVFLEGLIFIFVGFLIGKVSSNIKSPAKNNSGKS
jgi:hypothetical protein